MSRSKTKRAKRQSESRGDGHRRRGEAKKSEDFAIAVGGEVGLGSGERSLLSLADEVLTWAGQSRYEVTRFLAELGLRICLDVRSGKNFFLLG